MTSYAVLAPNRGLMCSVEKNEKVSTSGEMSQASFNREGQNQMVLEFAPGEVYKNNLGYYTVLKRRNGTISVRLHETGEVREFNVETQWRIIERQIRENLPMTKKVVHSSKETFFYTYGVLAAIQAIISVEVPSWCEKSIQHEYVELTGLEMDTDNGHFLVVQGDKYGPEWRLTFPSTISEALLEKLEFGEAEPEPRNPRKVSNNKYINALLKNGFVLGAQQDKGRIRGRLSPTMWSVFDQGIGEASVKKT